ncbi:MAG TPA: methyltransferase domain-containing protein [Deltaproteobacteria bacterium]|nr:methyltransferase domain-containing protein [Deltaproteobacteria bacterium]
MTQRAEDGPNAQQAEYWNDVSGRRWVEMGDVIDAQIAPLGRTAMERAGIEPGERIVDVGCGCGQTTLELAARVGEKGRVLGLDISQPMLESARDRAAREGTKQVSFEQADAQTHEFEAGTFDLLFSRFGVMFFSSPAEAFANLRSALRPGGRLTFIAWQEPNKNPWMILPAMAAFKHLPAPESPPDPTAPGPFAFADPERVEGILREAGFQDVGLEALERDLLVGGGRPLDETVEFLAQLGPAGAALREASPELRQTVMREIHDAITSYQVDDGIRMPSATWIASARNPG